MCLRKPLAQPAHCTNFLTLYLILCLSFSLNLQGLATDHLPEVNVAKGLRFADPVANPDSYNTDEDIVLNVPAPGVLGNDSDADGDPIFVTGFDGVSANGGIVVMNLDGSFTYTPSTNYNGNDTFNYTIDDGTGATATATVTITLAPINDDPLVIGDAYFTPEDQTLNVNTVALGVLNNDSDVEGNALTVSSFDATSGNGGTVVMTADGRFAYTPAANYFGTDTFNYTVSDGNGGSSSATVTITVVPVNDPPVAANDSYLIDEDDPLSVAAPGVLGNDTDQENNSLIISSFSSVSTQGGVVVVNPDGSFTYTPPSNFFGTDTFSYTIDDGNGGSASGVVSFSIAPINDDPQATDDGYITDEDTPLNVATPGLLLNDSDVDGDMLTVTSFDAISVVGGTVMVNPDGSFDYDPPTDYAGPDSFTYTIDDGNGGTATATVTIQVRPINDDPLANNDFYSTNEDVALNVPAPGVLSNDTDLEDILVVGAFDATTPNGGSVAINPDGSLTYTPAPNYFGMDTLNYTADDGNGGMASAQVIITVNPINDPPLVEDDTYSIDEDSTLSVILPGVLTNDSDMEGDLLTVTGFEGTSTNGGTVVMNPDGSFSFTPSPNFNGLDTFTYTADDGNGGTGTATVTISVLPVNDPPQAVDDSYGTDQNVPLSIPAAGVLSNDSDIEDTLNVGSYDAVSSEGGSIVMNPDGSFVYTPATDFAGLDTFSYRADDGNGGITQAIVTIAVDVPNSSPIAMDDFYETQEQLELVVNSIEEGVLSGDSDPDGNNLIVQPVTNESTTNGGQISINDDGTFIYNPAPGFIGTDSYEYTVCDDGIPEECTTAIVSILVKEGLFTFNSGFTPNDDGFNDSWTIEGISAYPNNKVKIYNRWGNLVYQIEGYNNMDRVWQGESNQGLIVGKKEVPSGSYYFLVYPGDGSKPLSGYIVLMR